MMAFVYKEWYEKNKEDVNAKRRKKYARDKAYREKQKKASRQYWRDSYQPSDATVVEADDGVKYYSISHFAEHINRSVATVLGYHRRGVLPEPSYNERGWRLYSKEQIKLAVRVFKKVDKGQYTLKDVKSEIEKKWEGNGA
jgi:hypothetical protein